MSTMLTVYSAVLPPSLMEFFSQPTIFPWKLWTGKWDVWMWSCLFGLWTRSVVLSYWETFSRIGLSGLTMKCPAIVLNWSFSHPPAAFIIRLSCTSSESHNGQLIVRQQVHWLDYPATASWVTRLCTSCITHTEFFIRLVRLCCNVFEIV